VSEVRGVDLFRLGGQAIAGWFPTYKPMAGAPGRQPFASLLELYLGLYLEYHPLVLGYGRGDVSDTQARSYRLPSALMFPISYTYGGVAHTYLPDWVGVLANGGRIIAEAGPARRKAEGLALAKAAAARRVAAVEGGIYLLGTEQTLAGPRRENWLFLHARRRAFPGWEEIAAAVRAQ
jgi:hypothetical protein